MRGFPRFLWEYIVASYFRWWMGIVTAGITLITTYEWLTTKTVPIPIWARLTFGGTALLIAPFFAYRELAERAASQREVVKQERAELQIHSKGGWYILHPGNRMFVELHLAIENKGEKNSIIDRFGLRVQQTDKEYTNISPTFKSGVRGRKGFRGFDPSKWLTQQGMTTVPAVDKIGLGVLLFCVPDLPPPGCLEVNCTLTVRDTEGNQASYCFVLSEV